MESVQIEEEPPTPVSAAQEPVDILKSLALDATFLHGDRRLALINGRVCAQGESLAISDAAAWPCVVAGISADKVLIEHQGRTVELKYRDPRSMDEKGLGIRD